ncbi:MAG TPA: IPTL-CTERM sorting domain-containing protein [Saprospiraceae bacterium]|nr:IPTL-CTERM sorting domain-containing protein [Saprospiraceae bacterium]HPN70268.1 IPTL-CTERM sorting domain-containing protein [Saprospiraceae bacterium]
MTLDQPTDIGPRFPAVPNFQPLPSGPIEKVGIFTNFFFGRMRISSFEVYGAEPIAPIPTLGEWGLIILALGMMIVSILAIKNSFVWQKKNS